MTKYVIKNGISKNKKNGEKSKKPNPQYVNTDAMTDINTPIMISM